MPFDLVVNLGLGAGLALVLGRYYVLASRSLSDRHVVAHYLTILLLTTAFVVWIVKINIFLTLGLVGALTITRFRTPVKDPEELAFIFFAVGIGITLAGDGQVAALVGFSVILGIFSVLHLLSRRPAPRGAYITVEGPDREGEESAFQVIRHHLRDHGTPARIRRVALREGSLEASFQVEGVDGDSLKPVISILQAKLPHARIRTLPLEEALAV